MTQHGPVVLTQETPMSPSPHGDLLGARADLTITHDGMIDTISLHEGGSLSGARLRVIGSYAAIVSIEAPGPR